MPADLAIRRRADLVSTTLDDAIMFMSVSQGNYYMLEGTGRAIWELIDGSRSVAEIVELLCCDYDITPERCEAEVRAFLEELERNGMLETGA